MVLLLVASTTLEVDGPTAAVVEIAHTTSKTEEVEDVGEQHCCGGG